MSLKNKKWFLTLGAVFASLTPLALAMSCGTSNEDNKNPGPGNPDPENPGPGNPDPENPDPNTPDWQKELDANVPPKNLSKEDWAAYRQIFDSSNSGRPTVAATKYKTQKSSDQLVGKTKEEVLAIAQNNLNNLTNEQVTSLINLSLNNGSMSEEGGSNSYADVFNSIINEESQINDGDISSQNKKSSTWRELRTISNVEFNKTTQLISFKTTDFISYVSKMEYKYNTSTQKYDSISWSRMLIDYEFKFNNFKLVPDVVEEDGVLIPTFKLEVVANRSNIEKVKSSFIAPDFDEPYIDWLVGIDKKIPANEKEAAKQMHINAMKAQEQLFLANTNKFNSLDNSKLGKVNGQGDVKIEYKPLHQSWIETYYTNLPSLGIFSTPGEEITYSGISLSKPFIFSTLIHGSQTQEASIDYQMYKFKKGADEIIGIDKNQPPKESTILQKDWDLYLDLFSGEQTTEAKKAFGDKVNNVANLEVKSEDEILSSISTKIFNLSELELKNLLISNFVSSDNISSTRTNDEIVDSTNESTKYQLTTTAKQFVDVKDIVYNSANETISFSVEEYFTRWINSKYDFQDGVYRKSGHAGEIHLRSQRYENFRIKPEVVKQGNNDEILLPGFLLEKTKDSRISQVSGSGELKGSENEFSKWMIEVNNTEYPTTESKAKAWEEFLKNRELRNKEIVKSNNNFKALDPTKLGKVNGEGSLDVIQPSPFSDSWINTSFIGQIASNGYTQEPGYFLETINYEPLKFAKPFIFSSINAQDKTIDFEMYKKS